ncbi:MAG: protein phosphatase 2C domain-containing protein [Ferruginibacter sp.]
MAEYFVGITDKGKLRHNNEDTFIVQELAGNGLIAACVIDGVGGYNGGEVAAGIARTVIAEHLQHLPPGVINAIREAIAAANDKILDEKKKDHKNDQMACVLTCAVVDITNNKFYYAHVGDTRLYLLRDHSLVKLSRDHSVVGFLEESGRLSEEDAMQHPMRNEINKALGFEENINEIDEFIESGESPFLPGDTILLCSDGLSDMINSNTISSILLTKKDLVEKAHDLVNAANLAGGKDNITAVLVENNKQPRTVTALKPVERKKHDGKPTLHIVEPVPEKKHRAPAKKNRNFIAFLALLTFGMLVILLFQNSTRLSGNSRQPKYTMPKAKDMNLDALIKSVNDSSRKYAVEEKGATINISDPLTISKDSFYFLGNGITIAGDPGYKKPALIISSKAKHVVLDSIVFRDLDVAIVLQKNNIIFKNVRFINCRVPVEYQLSFPDSIINGRIKDSILMPVSTPKQ